MFIFINLFKFIFISYPKEKGSFALLAQGVFFLKKSLKYV